MARYTCERCGADCNTLDDPLHLCKDLKRRYERNKKAIEIVSTILKDSFQHYVREPWETEEYEGVAVEIVKALAGRDLGVE